MKSIYEIELDSTSKQRGAIPYDVVSTDVDLYWHIAHLMYQEIETKTAEGKETVFIVPVGPVFQYRRFVTLCRWRPLDLSKVHFFFMDEYLDGSGKAIDRDHPLSFRGFIDRELVDPMKGLCGFRPDQVYFPDPNNPTRFDDAITALGGVDLCIAGVGVNGHMAFNEPPPESEATSDDEFLQLPSRVVRLARETRAMNANTAMGGAYELIPETAITVGFRQIMESRKLRIYLNRPWQAAVARKILFGEQSCTFPASLAARHRNAAMTLTELVARRPSLGLK